jgi:hypothetical protein
MGFLLWYIALGEIELPDFTITGIWEGCQRGRLEREIQRKTSRMGVIVCWSAQRGGDVKLSEKIREG